MFFSIFSFLFLVILVGGHAKASESQEDCLKTIVAKTHALKQEIDDALKSYKENCNSTRNSAANRDEDYEKLLAAISKKNVTILETKSKDKSFVKHLHEPLLNSSKKGENFVEKLRSKIANLGHRNTPKASSSSDGSTKPNVTSAEVEEFQRFLRKFVKCLKSQGKNFETAKQESSSHPTTSVPPYDSPETTTAASQLNSSASYNSKRESLLRYLANIQHPIQDSGRPVHKPPDLHKVQSIIDKIKNVDFFNLDEEEKETAKPEDLLAMPCGQVKRSSRNVFDHHKMVKKQKRKSNGLFDRGFEDMKFAFPVVKVGPSSDEKARELEENPAEDPQVAQPSEDEKLLGDLNRFESKLSGEQRMDISDFLDHIRDKPKPFRFDTTPFMQTEMDKLKRPNLEREHQDEEPEDETLLGFRKFFDFDSAPVKRSLSAETFEDSHKIAELKSKLIAEYRQHHPIIDYSDILRQSEAKNHRKTDNHDDDFLDLSYRLNDGSSRLNEVLKPFRTKERVMSPYELHLKLQLDNEFKELSPLDLKEPKTDARSGSNKID